MTGWPSAGLKPTLTVLGELRGADEGADLEGVFADGAAAQALHALARGRVALLLQLRLRGGQAQVGGHVFQLLRFGLRVGVMGTAVSNPRFLSPALLPLIFLTTVVLALYHLLNCLS